MKTTIKTRRKRPTNEPCAISARVARIEAQLKTLAAHPLFTNKTTPWPKDTKLVIHGDGDRKLWASASWEFKGRVHMIWVKHPEGDFPHDLLKEQIDAVMAYLNALEQEGQSL